MRTLINLLLVFFAVLLCTEVAVPQATRVMGEGSDAGKFIIGVIGDGYDEVNIAEADFAVEVERLIVDGLFAEEVFGKYRDSFSVYRLDVPSKQSGVSTAEEVRDTAIGLTFTDRWEDCWFVEKPNYTTQQIASHFNMKFYDYVIVIAKNGDDEGGCHPEGNRLYVSDKVSPNLIAHEFGHVVANLYDEYTVENYNGKLAEPGTNLNNCSMVTDRSLLDWRIDLSEGIELPTIQIPFGVEESEAVGMFEGCRYQMTGLYRPMRRCRMSNPSDSFCKVCKRLLHRSLKGLKNGKKSGLVFLPQGGYMKIEMRIGKSGSEIVRIEQVPDAPVTPFLDATSTFFYELSRSGKPTLVGSLNQDPFEVRAFPDRNKPRGEFLRRNDIANIVLTVPSSEFPNLIQENVQLKILELNAPKLSNPEKIQDIDQKKLDQLKKEGLLKTKIQIKPQDFKNVKLTGSQLSKIQ